MPLNNDQILPTNQPIIHQWNSIPSIQSPYYFVFSPFSFSSTASPYVNSSWSNWESSTNQTLFFNPVNVQQMPSFSSFEAMAKNEQNHFWFHIDNIFSFIIIQHYPSHIMNKRSLYLITGNVLLSRFRLKNFKSLTISLETNSISKTKTSIVLLKLFSPLVTRLTLISGKIESAYCFPTSKEASFGWRYFTLL